MQLQNSHDKVTEKLTTDHKQILPTKVEAAQTLQNSHDKMLEKLVAEHKQVILGKKEHSSNSQISTGEKWDGGATQVASGPR